MKVLVYPKDWNPYQELLYTPMRKNFGVKISYAKIYPVIGTSVFLLQSIIKRAQGYRLIHIHWQAFYLTVKVPYSKELSYWNSRFWIWWLRFIGYHVVWTVHNIIPHAPQTSNDLDVTRRLIELAETTIVHSPYVAKQMQEMGLDVSSTKVVPHGNYIGIYKDEIARSDARSILGLAEKDVAILFFGNVSVRKGVFELLEAYDAVRQQHQSLKLIIAGLCNDEVLHDKLLELQRRDAIILHDGRVQDDEVAKYFKACDVVCLPFKSVTTSGSALLALSFAKPVIAPRQGALQDLSKDIGYLYDPNKSDALSESLQSAIADNKNLKKKGDAAMKYAKTLSWEEISRKTYKIYQGAKSSETQQ